MMPQEMATKPFFRVLQKGKDEKQANARNKSHGPGKMGKKWKEIKKRQAERLKKEQEPVVTRYRQDEHGSNRVKHDAD
jgi:hypothetical protein